MVEISKPQMPGRTNRTSLLTEQIPGIRQRHDHQHALDDGGRSVTKEAPPVLRRRPCVEQIRERSDQLRCCERLRDDDAVRNAFCRPILIMGGDVDDWERRVLSPY